MNLLYFKIKAQAHQPHNRLILQNINKSQGQKFVAVNFAKFRGTATNRIAAVTFPCLEAVDGFLAGGGEELSAERLKKQSINNAN